ncbi:Glucokinase [Paenibacillus plantiphilus]|uniref:Glucokinase n=1 Tax=Paenibacillus plantiphilus TaxID=2905650 RepID=A0ABM9C1W4_9BACL|nr:ROK family protein [Paenibacillus plantiphilus]CAH1200570.1 Glucokinase [Paenibacillus plantiphilus]
MSVRTCISVDLGGTKLLAAVIDERGSVLRREVKPTPVGEGAAVVLETIAASVLSLTRESKEGELPPEGIAIVAAGTIDIARSIIRYAANLKFRDVAIGDELRRLTGLPVLLENDANGAAYGEWKHGAGVGSDDCLFITVSTGIGGGFVSGGRLVRGATGSAGEIGHISIDRSGPLCPCGNRGCVELYASGTAIARTAARDMISGARPAGRVGELSGGEAANVTSRHVAQAAAEGDPYALAVAAEAGRALGFALISGVHLLNPQVVVIGGGASHIGDPLLGPMRETFVRYGIRSMTEPVRIDRAKLGGDAGIIGAAALWFDSDSACR